MRVDDRNRGDSNALRDDGYLMKGVAMLDTLSATIGYHEYETARLAVDRGSELNVQVQAK